MTLQEGRDRVKHNVRSIDENIDAIVDVALRHAQKRISSLFDFPVLQKKVEASLTAGKRVYSFNELGLTRIKGNLIYSVTYLKSEDATVVDFLNPAQWDEQVLPSRELEGEPVYYTIWGKNVEIHRKPDNTYTLQIRYHAWPEFPATADTEFELADVDECIEALATSHVFASLEEGDSAARWARIFQHAMTMYVREHVKHLNIKPTSKTVGVRWLEEGVVSDYWKNPFMLESP